ncbi:hypothetical protein NUU61_007780 [Penicillium alfredii]|uniref:Uncharacterized protein n=1 Tax=Penicillium alfredii TaxID=1506179 RepID=A0A9W9JYN2_9EURO|nr:uncharacterized protein NUU61_007780 [Penicillium alfredii]KAJ5086473.1 hypothetical protein NUU61_007780 [Penicillium alfredii]
MHLKPVALMAVLAAHRAATPTETTNERMSAAYDYAANEYSLDGASAVMKADMKKGTCYIDFNISGAGCTTVMKHGGLTEYTDTIAQNVDNLCGSATGVMFYRDYKDGFVDYFEGHFYFVNQQSQGVVVDFDHDGYASVHRDGVLHIETDTMGKLGKTNRAIPRF